MPSRSSWKTFLGLLAISLLALAVHGYHYGIEDEAIYLPAVKQRLNAALYPFDSAFFQAQSQLMLFDRLIAALCRLTHLSVDWAFFLLYCLTTFLFVLALRRLGERFFPDEPSRWAAVLLPAALLTMPVAGSAVFIMDQHMHPRNLATVALLFALAAVLDKRWVAAGVLVVAAAVIHPLVTLYGASLLCMLAWRRTILLHFLALAVFLSFAWFLLPPPPAGWWHAVEAYIFISEWTWYEWLGILGPLACLLGCARWASRSGLPLVVTSARRLVWYGLFYFSVAAVLQLHPAFCPIDPLAADARPAVALPVSLSIRGRAHLAHVSQAAHPGVRPLRRAMRWHVLRPAAGVPSQPARRMARKGPRQSLAPRLRLDPAQHTRRCLFRAASPLFGTSR